MRVNVMSLRCAHTFLLDIPRCIHDSLTRWVCLEVIDDFGDEADFRLVLEVDELEVLVVLLIDPS